MTERSEAKRDGAKLQKNSGRGHYQKGDMRLGPFIVDLKEYGKSFSISKDNWAKICGDAWRSNGEPALKLVVGEKDNEKVRLWVISDLMFQQMLECWEDKYGRE